jgi:hypothetical protein
MSLLSVIIPSYNRAALVEQTLQSLVKQSNADFQTIVVDHGSTDNTAEICQKFKGQLQITYYKIERHAYSPGEPRDFGVSRAETPLILFLDSGTIVPSWYITAHLVFHKLHPGYVGIGLQYRNDDAGDFKVWENIDLAQPEFAKAQFIDGREGFDLGNSVMPWLYGWTANLSLPREAYILAGGFDLDLKGWGFEDVDLCYRIYKRGFKHDFVEDGWSLEVPQPRESVENRMENGQKNMRSCYEKQQGLGLEIVLLASLLLRTAVMKYKSLPTTDLRALQARMKEKMRAARPHASQEEIFRYLTTIGQEIATWPAIPAELRAQFTGPTLLVGGTLQDAEWCDYVTLLDDRKISTPSLWSCCGIILPLADQTLGTVVVSDIWKKLDWSVTYDFGLPSLSLLDVLISEIRRTAKQAFFLDSQPIPFGASVETLSSLCQKHDLPFKILSPEYAS